MKMNCNMACKSNQNLNKQMRCSSWYLLNTQNLVQYKAIKETGFFSRRVTTNFCPKLVLLLLLSASLVQASIPSVLIVFPTFKPPRNSRRVSYPNLEGKVAHSIGAKIPQLNIYYNSGNLCLLLFPSFWLVLNMMLPTNRVKNKKKSLKAPSVYQYQEQRTLLVVCRIKILWRTVRIRKTKRGWCMETPLC